MDTKEVTYVIRALGAWRAGQAPIVQAWAKTIQQNLRRLRRNPTDPSLLGQTAKNVEGLRKTLHTSGVALRPISQSYEMP